MRRTLAFGSILPLLALALAGCGGRAGQAASAGARRELPPPGKDAFVDVTRAAGIDFIHAVGDGHMDNILESLGSGAAWIDVDGDEDMDLFLVDQTWTEGISAEPKPASGATGSFRLYVNRGDGTFDDRSEAAGVARAGFGFSVAAADYDGDGHEDLYVFNCGANVLFRNRGDGTFEDVTAKAGLEEPRCSTGGTFFDADGDGDLDLYVGNYLTFDPNYQIHYSPDVYPGPLAYEAQPDALYLNQGDGTFVDGTAASGIGAVAPGRAMGVTALDYDDDGRVDLFVANDQSENFLFHALGGGRFENVAVESGVAYGVNGEATGAMAGVVGDLDGDGRPDILVTDTSYGSLYHYTDMGLFEDVAIESGLAAPSGQWVSWGGGFFDYDNDGDQDVFEVDGDLKRPTGRPDRLLENDGHGKLTVADGGPYFRRELLGRGGAFADVDGDGDVDVLVTTIGGPPVLLRNDVRTANHWISLSLDGAAPNRDAIGARVVLHAGARDVALRHVLPSGYLTQSDPRIHVGLGTESAPVSVEITWPDGRVEKWSDLPVDAVHRLHEGEGKS